MADIAGVIQTCEVPFCMNHIRKDNRMHLEGEYVKVKRQEVIEESVNNILEYNEQCDYGGQLPLTEVSGLQTLI